MKDIAAIALATFTVVSLFGFAAYLMLKQVDGWFWYLLCVVLVVGSLRVSTTG